MAAGTDSRAVEGGGGAGEFELARQRPALLQSIDKTSMEDVASAGRVDRVDAKRRGVVELPAVIREDAFVAEGGGGESRAVAGAHGGKRLAQIGFAGNAAGDVEAGYKVVDQREEGVDAGVEFVEVGDDGDPRGARPGGGDGCGGGVVAVEVKGAGFEDPVALEVAGLEGEAVVALPEDGALASVVDEDEGLLAGAARRGEEMRFDAEVCELGAVQRSGEVVADFADIAGAEPPRLAGDHSGGDLAAGEHVGGAEFDFGAGGGVMMNRNKRVGGVEADADDVDFGCGGHLTGPNVKEVRRDAKRNAVGGLVSNYGTNHELGDWTGVRLAC